MTSHMQGSGEIGRLEDTAEVELAPDLVPLLSDQLYQSPLKAIEELVVNSYDAEAKDCYISILPEYNQPETVSVADDGFGMDAAGLKNLWHVGRSSKRSAEYLRRVSRKQIGKFGIGKLAAYSIAKVITYYTCSGGTIRRASLDFGAFEAERNPHVRIPIHAVAVGSADAQAVETYLKSVCRVPADFFDRTTWTVCLLTELKPKSSDIRIGRLEWVLKTAMPLVSTFKLHLNGKAVPSAKEGINKVVEITSADFPQERISELAKRITSLKRDGDRLVSDALPAGLTFSARVYEQTLSGGKSEDLGRSHGFFVKVRGRLINERDELFGLSPASYKTWYRFQAEIEADDLDTQITASRESLEESASVGEVRLIASAIFLEARNRFEDWADKKDEADRKKREEGRNPVSPRLVEMPVADAVRRFGTESSGADADTNWFYLDLEGEEATELSTLLYGPREGVYSYRVDKLGEDERIVKFHARDKLFVMNEDHPLIREYSEGDKFSVRLLQDFVTAEALLEVNLRQANIPLKIIGEVLQTRDKLIRSLARNEIYSLKSVADELRKSYDNKYDLEIALVAAARALGLIAKHIGGAGRPDGLARYIANNGSETKITLEAKSSQSTPSLSAIDFGGIAEHRRVEGASGCLLLAPSYPGSSRADDAAAAKRAEDAKCSCWTVAQLASVVEAAEAREISAKDVLDIIHECYTPEAVSSAVANLLSTPNGHRKDVYTDVVDTMEAMLARPVLRKALTVDLLAGRISALRDIEVEEVSKAVKVVAEASRGLIQLRDTEIVVLGSFEELRRRLGNLISGPVSARRLGDFRNRT